MASAYTWLPLIIGLSYLTFAFAMAGDFNSIELSKPQRPRVFTSPDELRNYLEALGRYYALAGRNRYGKRSAQQPQEIPSLPVESTKRFMRADK